MFRSWIRTLFAPPFRAKRRSGAKTRLTFLGLEDRTVPTFLATTSYVSGLNPHGIGVGDFNGDGKADMAVTSTNTASVGILLGNGNGTFQPRVDFAAGMNPWDAVAGDFNADGKIDLAVAGWGLTGGTVSVLIGNGDGTFVAPVAFTAGLGTHSIKLGDFNGDGKLDLATMNSYTASILLGNGDGTFQAAINTPIPGSSTRAVVADFNRDGKLDLATSNTSSVGTATILIGNGDGTFQPATNYSMFSAPVDLVAGDFNGDGITDLASPNSYASSSMTIIYGNGDGTFSPPHTDGIPQTGYEIESGDYDGDGYEDIAVRGGSSYMIRLGKGNGSWYPTVSYPAPSGVFQEGTSGDFNGDGAVDFVAPTGAGSVMVTMNANDDKANVGTAVGFVVSAPSTVTANAALPMTVTAVDAIGNPVTGFVGTVYFGSSDPQIVATTPYYTFTAADAGTHTFATTVRLSTLGVQTVSVSTPFLSPSTTSVNVTPAATRFVVSAPAAATAGNAFDVTVTAADAFGNAAVGYGGTVTFSSSDVQASLPSAYTFTLADAGVHTFSVTLKTAGWKTITTLDSANLLYGSTSATVSAAAATGLTIAIPSGPIGVSRPVTVSARDQFGNVNTTYTGTVHFTSTDAAAVLPPDAAFVNGIASASVTFMTVGTQTITATATANPSFTAMTTVVDAPAVLAGFTLTGYPASTAGIAHTIQVRVVNSISQVMTDYVGTVVFGSTDGQAGLPASYTFTAADRGQKTFTATLKTAGLHSIIVYDLANSALYGSQAGILMTSAAPAAIAVSGFPATVAGVAHAFTVTAHDAFGNVATGYTGTMKFASTDAQAVLPANYRFTAADAGTHVFAGTFKTAAGSQSVGGQNLTAQDTGNVSLVATQTNIIVSNAAMTHVGLSAPSNILAGTAFSLKVQALDDFGNKVNDYQGTVHFANSAGAAGLPPDFTFSAADNGSHTFTVTLNVLGVQTLSVWDLANTALMGSTSITVGAIAGGGGGTGGGGSGGGGKKP